MRQAVATRTALRAARPPDFARAWELLRAPALMKPIGLLFLALVAIVGTPAAHAQPMEPGCEEAPSFAPLESLSRVSALAGGDVPAETQQRTIDEILRRVRAQAERHGRDAREPMPVVQIDIDLTAVRPEERVSRALAAIGRDYRIPELLDPASLPVLPAYNRAAFFAFLDRVGLRDRFWDWRWRWIHARFESLFWGGDWGSDVPSAGLAAFVRAVEGAGGRVVFNSARDGGSRGVSIASLERAGLVDPVVFLKNNAFVSDRTYKRRVQTDIAELGRTVAIIDDLGENRVAVDEGVEGDVLQVAFLSAGFTNERTRDAASLRWALSTFEGRY